MHHPKIGILGGMGPRSTAPFLTMVIDECQAQYGASNDEEFPPIIIFSLPTPFYVDKPIDHDRMKERIIAGLQELEATGVAFISMPCNFAHQYWQDLQASIGIPLLNMISEAANRLDLSHPRVAIIGTAFTIASKIYEEPLVNRGFTVVDTSPVQSLVNEVIKGIKLGSHMNGQWQKILDYLQEQRTEQIVLACTDLNVLPIHSSKITIVDATRILAETTVIKYVALRK